MAELARLEPQPGGAETSPDRRYRPVSDRRAVLIGIEAYVAAGGNVIRDLFDAVDDGYLADAALVERLVAAKMDAACAALRAEGWRWVKAELSRDYATSYGRVERSWDDEIDEDGEDSGDGGEPPFAPEDLARAGALVTLGPDGTLRIERGLIHPDDVRAESRAARPQRPAEPGALAAALVTDLSAHRTAALRIELARNPAVALAVTVHALALPLLYGAYRGSCLDLRATSEPLARHTKVEDDSSAHRAMADEQQRWRERLPGDAAGLLAWCLAQPQAVLLDLLAFAAALTVDAVETKGDGRSPAADDLAAALSLDMNTWWQPSAEGFWHRLPKAALIHAMSEAKVTTVAPLMSVKKAEAAKLVAKAMQGSGWLPQTLRRRPPADAV